MIKSRDELLAELKEKFGADNSEEFVEILENVSDTFNDLSTRLENSGDWEQKYKELDEEWRRKYADRFLSSNENEIMNPPEDEPEDNDKVTFNDLFE